MLPPWPSFVTNSNLSDQSWTGAPSQTGEMSSDGLYVKTMAGEVFIAESQAG